MVMFGALAAAASLVTMEIPFQMLEDVCKNTVGKKYPQLIDSNLAGLRKGYLTIKEQTPYSCNETDSSQDSTVSLNTSYVWGYDNAPLGGINPRIGSTVSNDLSASREGYIPLFQKEKCINCGLCDSTCPDMVFQFFPGVYNGKNTMLNQGLDYSHCKGCLRCVEICPTNALVLAYEKDYEHKPHNQPNRHLLCTDFSMEKRGADPSITSDSYLTEKQINGGVL